MKKTAGKNNYSLSKKIFEESKKRLVGGVNSPVRAFGAVGGSPPIIERGKGSKIYDVDGHEYIDFVNSWGALLLGHANPKIIDAIRAVLEKGTSFGAPIYAETRLAQTIQKYIPSMEKMRFVSSGTEATQSAVRLARGYTKKSKIIKFEGCYHGHTDSLLVKAGSGGATLGVPSSEGIPEDIAKHTIVLPYNDISYLEDILLTDEAEIAAVIIEPVAANMGVVLPKRNYLEKIQALCIQHKVLLIFDEVITGFRLALGGAQAVYGIKPDLTCLGKIVGGGLPIGVYGGKKEIMENVSPLGKVYQAGTLSGNPLSMAAGIAMLNQLSRPGTFKILESKTKYLCEKLSKILRRKKIPHALNWAPGMFTLFFAPSFVYDYTSAAASDTKAYAKYFHFMLENGIYLPPSQFEACMISLAHSKKELDFLAKKGEEFFQGQLF